jgi:SNF2 family DNA or RNA helicase
MNTQLLEETKQNNPDVPDLIGVPQSQASFFINKISDLKENVIHFSSVTINIAGTMTMDNVPIIFKNYYLDGYGEKLGIYHIIEGDGGKDEHLKVATFYNSYEYTQAFSKIIKNNELSKQFNFYITTKNIPELTKCELKVDVYIDKNYLLDIFEAEKIPNLIYLLAANCAKKENQHPSNFKRIKEENNYNIDSSLYLEDYKRKPFKYQQENINWMVQFEEKIDNNLFDLNFPKLPNSSHINKFNIPSINETLFVDTYNKNIFSSNNFSTVSINPIGGVLSDGVGLGKTFSMIGLIKERRKPEDPPTLVICPRRLGKQWKQEIDITCDLTSKVISSITQFRKITFENINSYDIYIFSYSFFENKSYQKYLDNNQNSENYFSLHNFKWNRVILDEGHEYLNHQHYIKQLRIRDNLKFLKSNYRWICSGTPFSNYVDLLEIIFWLFKITDKQDQRLKYNILRFYQDKILSNLFRRNTKKSVSNQVKIPEPKMLTEFLNQTVIEKAIYDSALGNTQKMVELCNHIMVSEDHINILGNKPLSMEQIHVKMTAYYAKKIEYLTKRLDNIGNNILSNDNNLVQNSLSQIQQQYQLLETQKEINNQLLTIKSKYTIFNSLNQKIKEAKCCPICLDDLSNSVMTVTECGHFFCGSCISTSVKEHHINKCPMCRAKINTKNLQVILPKKKKKEREDSDKNINKWGTKMARLIKYLNEVLCNPKNRVIVFSQFDNMLKLVGNVLLENNISHLFLKGSANVVQGRIRKFKLDPTIRIILLSSEKAASGLNLTEANNIVLLDSHNAKKNICKIIEEQAIGRSVRLGQKESVIVKRFVMKDTIEEKNYINNFAQ